MCTTETLDAEKEGEEGEPVEEEDGVIVPGTLIERKPTFVGSRYRAHVGPSQRAGKEDPRGVDVTLLIPALGTFVQGQ